MVLFSLLTVGFAANALGGAGGPLAVFFIAIAASEFGKAISKETKIDISRYIEDGSNVIIYNPAVCSMKMYVELVEAYEKNQCFEKEILDDND